MKQLELSTKHAKYWNSKISKIHWCDKTLGLELQYEMAISDFIYRHIFVEYPL